MHATGRSRNFNRLLTDRCAVILGSNSLVEKSSDPLEKSEMRSSIVKIDRNKEANQDKIAIKITLQQNVRRGIF